MLRESAGSLITRGLVLGAVLTLAAPAGAQQDLTVLQWFEARWGDLERRAPDFFAAGYDAVWLPPASKAWAAGSAGYDVFDRFDLGRPGAETLYGTEAELRAMVRELQLSGARVYLDLIMNHNSGRQTSAAFQAAGGYPGFWMAPSTPPVNKTPTSNWGDFHAGNASGYLQSHNPGGANYDLLRGDLVALIDIAQESDHHFIRHPVQAGHPQNLPAGTVYNLPDAASRRFYPDLQLTPLVFVNPGTARNPGAIPFTIHPFNTGDPLQGDAVADNATGLLMRHTQWMLDEVGVDGFRLDAVKHVPSWFWDRFWDSAVHRRWKTAGGTVATPLSFGESVESNFFTYTNYVRKDAFANRDALDLNGAGQLRDLVGASGFGSWANVLSAHLDNEDDGMNNGSLGVNHVFSHDNGSVGDGSSPPPLPTARQQALAEHAYLLLRPGPAIVYHNARGVSRPGGFWPRQGVPGALGLDYATNGPDPTTTRLARIRSWVGRGELAVLNGTDPVNQSLDDVLVFERRRALGAGTFSANVLVGVNDRYDAGVQVRSILTSFPAGTRLHELTGNADDPVVDPGNQVPSVLTVDPNRRVLITVPNNRSTAGEHGRGYVVYAPALPTTLVTISNTAGTIAPDPQAAPPSFRRLTAVPVISAPTFDLVVTTAQTDPLDPNTDDNALFRFNRGYVDLNGNGIVDFPEGSGVVAGYEQFLTLNQPLFGSAGTEGRYRQTISTANLPEGFNYISVLVFRHRNANEDPLFREARVPVYVDRSGPEAEWANQQTIVTSSYLFKVRMLDRTGQRVHVFWDLPAGTDPVPLASPFNQATRFDRFEWRRTLDGLTHGFHALTIVTFEESGNASVRRYEGVFVNTCRADFNQDGILNLADFGAFQTGFALGDPRADFNGDGVLNLADFGAFQTAFALGCS